MDVTDRLTTALSDRYTIESEIDSGGMATVYRALDLKHERTVAIKVLRPDLAEAIGADRFLREIRTTANLSHPHILPLHDSGEADGFLFYVMPFVKGESLRDRLEREGQLPIEDAVQIAREVADALAYAHRNGVIHRDIKPANIMLDEGHALLADFGIAQAKAGAEETRLTGSGMSLGTPAYMSPEQVSGEGEVDGRADQYALGCVLYEMLAGHPPFTGADIQTVMRQHLAADAPSVTQARPAVPKEVAKTAHRALAKAPADRFRTMEEFGKALAGATRFAWEPGAWPLWLVALGYLASSLVILGAAGTLTGLLGLPDWVPLWAGIICLASLPPIFATAVFQRRRAVGGPSWSAGLGAGMGRWFTWGKVGGMVGILFLLLTAAAPAYMAMRTLGIGPMGTLLGKGVLEERARLLVADLGAPAGDSILAFALSSALRAEIASSPVVRLVHPEEVQRTLTAMRLPRGTRLSTPVALEAATREGIPLVLVGDLTELGSRYLISVRLMDPDQARVHLALAEEAGSEDELIEAGDRLSAKVRERIGESLRSVRNRPPFQKVTTASMEALKLYERGQHALAFERDYRKALNLTEEALALDSTFAEGWRRLGIILGGLQEDRQRQLEATTRAFELRDQLPEEERLNIEASYYATVEIDYRKTVEALERAVQLNPESRWWGNLGSYFRLLGRWEEALAAMRRALELQVDDHGTENFIQVAIALGDLEAARWALDLRREQLPDHPRNPRWEAEVAYARGDRAEARRTLESTLEAETTPGTRGFYRGMLGILDRIEGRLESWEAGMSELGVDSVDLLLAKADNELFIRNRPEEAASLALAALQGIDLSDIPPVDRPNLLLSYTWCVAGRPREAQAALDEWLAATPPGSQPANREDVLNRKGWIAGAEGRTEEGLESLRQAARVSHSLPLFQGDLSLAYDQAEMPDSALAAYHRFLEAPNWGRWTNGSADALNLARTYERLGQLHEERGELEEAARYHGLFVELWADADPELQPRVRAAREALERLERQGVTVGSGVHSEVEETDKP